MLKCLSLEKLLFGHPTKAANIYYSRQLTLYSFILNLKTYLANYVLTAAHCEFDPYYDVIALGSILRQGDSAEVIVRGINVINHPRARNKGG